MRNTVRLRASVPMMAMAIAALTAVPLRSQQDARPSPQGKSSKSVPESSNPPESHRYVDRLSGIEPPKITHAVPATYPPDAPADITGSCLLSVVIDADGHPKQIRVVHSFDKSFDEAAIKAVEQSAFSAGVLNRKPVPVRLVMEVRFAADRSPALPQISEQSFQAMDDQKLYDKPPKLIYAPEAEYSKQARAAKLKGSVVVQLEVSEKGLPTELRVVRSLGSGLDEKALEAVQQYRFKPAMKDGKPVPVRMTIEVKFKLY